MTSLAALTGSHLRTYDTLFQHPASHNLQWHDVHALFRHLAAVEEEPNGNLRVVRNGQTIVLHPPRTKDVADIDDLMALRHFLQRSDTVSSPAAEAVPPDAHWLLVIDHEEARIFRTETDGTKPLRIRPHRPGGHFRHAHDSQAFSHTREKPDPTSFFAPVAQALGDNGPILVLGGGTGRGGEMEQFIAWANIRHPELGQRIVGSVIVDEHHLSEEQLLAKARAFYANEVLLHQS